MPKPAKPVPITTVRVYFSVRADEDFALIITFRFEKDSLIHSLDHTIRKKTIEVRLVNKSEMDR